MLKFTWIFCVRAFWVTIFIVSLNTSKVDAEQQSPLSIRELQLGMPSTDYASIWKKYKRSESDVMLKMDIKGETLTILPEFNTDKKLYAIFGFFKRNVFNTMYDALLEKYGKSKSCITNEYHNMYGVKFTSKSCQWNINGDTILISQGSKLLGDGLFSMCSKEYNDEQERIKNYKHQKPGF